MYICEVERLHKALQNVTKGSFSGATLSFALRSKGEGGQSSYLIIQEVAVYFRDPPPSTPSQTVKWVLRFLHGQIISCNMPNTARCCPKNTVNTVVFATRSKTHRKYWGFGLPRQEKHRYLGCFFCSESSQKNTKTPTIWRFSATTRRGKKLQG